MKKFNITGKCVPERHYMVDITERVEQIGQMVVAGDYFCINRGRQYGKTTTLSLLKRRLDREYSVFSISFEGCSDTSFSSFERLGALFFRLLHATLLFSETCHVSAETAHIIAEKAACAEISDSDFSLAISLLVKANDCPVVLMIDEVDRACNHEAFLTFLGMLRDKFLSRDTRPTFQSVILAGVYDIKNLKLKIRTDKDHQTNSPWNIAAPFTTEMSLSCEGIAGMLTEYEADHHTGMEVSHIAQLLYDYTSGYPFLVTRLCMLMDATGDWSGDGFLAATRLLLKESNTLFEDTSKKLEDFPELRTIIYRLLFCGEEFPFNAQSKAQEIGCMFNFIADNNGKVSISNRILEIWFYNLFIADEKLQESTYNQGAADKPQFVKGNRLDMPLILARFASLYSSLYDVNRDTAFDEEEGRKKFIFYLKPIINGIGNYYVESRTRSMRRTDLVIDYLGKQYIVELKIWHGEQYNAEGETQLADYLDAHGADTGYLLTFCFNKKLRPASPQTKRRHGKTLYEVIV